MFRDIRIEILNLTDEQVGFNDNKTTLKLVIFGESLYIDIYKYDIDTPSTYTYKYDAVRTVLYTSSGGGGGERGIGPVYSVSPFVHRGHGIGIFLRGLWRTVRPILWSGAKSLERESLRLGGNIMNEIAANPGQTSDILSKHATETTKNIIKKLRGGGHKRKKPSSHSHKAKRVKIAKRKSSKRTAPPKTIKRDILMIRISHYPIISGEVVCE